MRLIGVLLPPEVFAYVPLTLDPYAVPFTGALALATGVLFGLFPAFHRHAGGAYLGAQGRGRPAGRCPRGRRFPERTGRGPVRLGDDAAGAGGLFIQSLRNQDRVDLGIRTPDVVTFRLSPAPDGRGDG